MTRQEFVRYRCDTCGAWYAEEGEAVACESGHKAVTQYSPVYEAGSAYPTKIKVKFDDEKDRVY